MQEGSSSKWLWIALGCGFLVVVGTCAGGAIAFYFFAKERVTAESSQPAPLGGAAPVPPSAADPSAGSGVTLAPMDPPSLGNPPPLPPPPGPVGPFDATPRTVVATVTSVRGAQVVPVGAECRFDVRRVREAGGAATCNAQVHCGQKLLYGGPTAGFFPCTIDEPPARDVVGSDGRTTAEDSDAALELDTRAGRLRIRDDASGPHGAYELEAAIARAL